MSIQEDAIHLTRTERRLLTCLVRNAGRIASHRELIQAMSSISRLRNKMEADPGLPRVIITHHKLADSFAGKQGAQWFPELEPLPLCDCHLGTQR